MYTIEYDGAGYAYLILKDGSAYMHLQVGAETTLVNAEEMVRTLNRTALQEEKEMWFREILERISVIGKVHHLHHFHNWFMSDDTNMREFRIFGGSGFKLRRRSDGMFFFDQQYEEEITSETDAWVKRTNEWLEQNYDLHLRKVEE